MLVNRVESSELTAEEITSEVQRALSRLPAIQREVVLMQTVCGLTIGDISVRLRLTDTAVKDHLAAGMAALIPMFDSLPGLWGTC